jgi:hypothetical protein
MHRETFDTSLKNIYVFINYRYNFLYKNTESADVGMLVIPACVHVLID